MDLISQVSLNQLVWSFYHVMFWHWDCYKSAFSCCLVTRHSYYKWTQCYTTEAKQHSYFFYLIEPGFKNNVMVLYKFQRCKDNNNVFILRSGFRYQLMFIQWDSFLVKKFNTRLRILHTPGKVFHTSPFF